MSDFKPMSDDDKVTKFLEIMAINRQNTFALLKNFLVTYNPPLELIDELKKIIEDQNIFLENDAFDFLDKWKDYKRCLKNSVEIQYKESVTERFNEIMEQNFGAA